MADTVTPTTPTDEKVTAALSTNVSFNQQVNQADTALQDRNKATKNARAAWLALVDKLAEYNVTLARRRGTVDAAYGAIGVIRVNKEASVTEEEKDVLREAYQKAAVLGNDYHLKNLLENDEACDALEALFPGFVTTMKEKIVECRKADKALNKATKTPGEDRTATKTAQDEAKELAAAFATAMEQLEDSADVLTGVRDYIGVVEQIANIQAVANGGTKA
jgi:hypothetical protein